MENITIFIASLGGGGAENVCKNIVNYFANNNVKVTLVLNNLHNDVYLNDIDNRVNIKILEAKSMKSLPIKLFQYLKKNNMEKILVFSYEISIILLFLRKMLRKNFIIYSRCINTISYERKYEKSFFRKYITHSLIKKYYSKMDYIIAQSEKMKEDLIENYDCKKDKVYVINNPLSNIYIEEMKNNTKIERKDYILFIGRLEEQKGINMLINAFSKIDDLNKKLIIVGNGSCRNKVEDLIEELGVNKRVEIIGFTKEAIKYYKEAKVVVLTSYFEGFPNVLIESIACGTPIVSFDCPSGPNEIIVRENGLLVKYLDEKDLVDKLNKALEKEWDEVVIKKSATRYDIKKIMNKYMNVIFTTN